MAMNGGSSVPQIPTLPGYQSSGSNVLDASATMYGQNPGLSTSPQYQALGGAIVNNPANQTGANMGMGAATNNFNTGGQTTGAGTSLYPYAQNIMQTAFDPQQQLYNQTLQQSQDQWRTSEAARGIEMSPYGAGLENKATSDFNINWQNNQLNREATGASAAGGLVGAGAGAATAGQGMQTPAGQQYAQASNAPMVTGMQALDQVTQQGNTAQQIPQQYIQDLMSYLGIGNQNYQIQGQEQQQAFNQNNQTMQNLGSAAGFGLSFL
jgi:hypothetical protein